MSSPANGVVVFGGSFDPVHRGHIVVAEQVLNELPWSSVLFVPAAHNPLKRDAPCASDRDRMKMIWLAIQSDPRFAVSDIELTRAAPSYTYNTIVELQSRGILEDEPALLIGDDVLAQFPRWYRAQDLLRMVHLVVAVREAGPERTTPAVPEWADPARYHVVHNQRVPVSSTGIRRMFGTGPDTGTDTETSNFLDPQVDAYIREHGLYGYNGIARNHNSD